MSDTHVLAFTILSNGYAVSTVRLPDYYEAHKGPQYETMIFKVRPARRSDPTDRIDYRGVYQLRAATQRSALIDHGNLAARYRPITVSAKNRRSW